MQDDIFAQCHQWFNEHVSHYREKAGSDIEMVDRKKRHTLRVLAHARAIVEESAPLVELAEAVEIAALLHDAGRFPQIVGQTSYEESEEDNHAEAGVRIILDADLLDPLLPKTRGIILSAIKYHNHAVVPDNLGTEARLVLEVLRDSDKLDAVRNNLKYLKPGSTYGKAAKSGMTWHEENISPEVLAIGLNRQPIPLKDINWSNDYFIFLCCWLYDMHFPYAFRHLRTSGHFEILLGLLPDSPECIQLKEQLTDDLNWIIARSRP